MQQYQQQCSVLEMTIGLNRPIFFYSTRFGCHSRKARLKQILLMMAQFHRAFLLAVPAGQHPQHQDTEMISPPSVLQKCSASFTQRNVVSGRNPDSHYVVTTANSDSRLV